MDQSERRKKREMRERKRKAAKKLRKLEKRMGTSLQEMRAFFLACAIADIHEIAARAEGDDADWDSILRQRARELEEPEMTLKELINTYVCSMCGENYRAYDPDNGVCSPCDTFLSDLDCFKDMSESDKTLFCTIYGSRIQLMERNQPGYLKEQYGLEL